MSRKILLDTSFILMAVDLGKDLLSMLNEATSSMEIVVTESVLNELSRIAAKSKGLRSRKAKLALKIIKGVKVIPSSKGKAVDEELIELAEKEGLAVATTDSNLIKKLRMINLPIILIKDGSVKIEGFI